MSDTKFNCEIVQDLLPLYVDEVCSPSSRKMVEEHIAECAECKKKLQELQDQSVTKVLSQERYDIIGTHVKKEKRRSTIVGIVTAACLMIPLIVCLICNIATAHALNWFFIVLASLSLFASITVVPLLVLENRGLWTLGAFMGSLTFLFAVCCIYSHGRWFWIATVPTLMGLLIFFAPYIVKHVPLPKIFLNNKALLTMIIETIAVFCIIVAAGIYSRYAGYWKVALPITTFCLSLPWVILLVARYVPIRKSFKGSLISLSVTAFFVFISDFVNFVIGEFEGFTFLQSDLAHWSPEVLNGNIYLIMLLAGLGISAIFGTIGVAGMIRKNRKKNKTEM